MDSSNLLEPLMKNMKPIRLIDIISFLAIPTWILHNFYPVEFYEFMHLLPVDKISMKVNNILIIISKLLVSISYSSVILLTVLGLTKVIQKILKGIKKMFLGYGYSNLESSADQVRASLSKFLFYHIFLRIAVYNTALSWYNLLIFCDSSIINYLKESNAFYVSYLPLEALAILVIIGLIIP